MAPERIKRLLGWLLPLLIGFLIPIFTQDPYILGVLILALLSSLMALAIRLVFLVDLINVAVAAFLAIGAYASAVLTTKADFSPWFSLPITLVITGIFALGIGFFILRTRGIYFIVITIAINGVIKLLITNSDALEGARGYKGIPGLTLPGFSSPVMFERIHYYYLVLILLSLVVLLSVRLDNSRFGLAMKGVRENEPLGESVGISGPKCKLTAFFISSVIIGVAGWFYAHFYQFIAPDEFTLWRSIEVLIMAQFGGVVFVSGPIFGAFLLVLIPEVFREIGAWKPIFLGLAIILGMRFFPGGAVLMVHRGANIIFDKILTLGVRFQKEG